MSMHDIGELLDACSNIDVEDTEAIIKACKSFTDNIPMDEMSEKLQMLVVMRDYKRFGQITNPTDMVKKAMLSVFGNGINLLYDPTEEMKEIAVRQNGMAIRFIQNPSKQLQLLAVEQNVFSICYINDADEEVQLRAISIDSRVIDDIRLPTENAAMVAKLSN